MLIGGLLFTLPVFWISQWVDYSQFWLRWILAGVLLKPVFSYRRLIEAGAEGKEMLQQDNLEEARQLVSWHLVSRDTTGLSQGHIASAVIESLAENLTDSLMAPLFFFVLFGLPGAWLYRFVNTADAMIGYRDERYKYLGKFAARLDDTLNFLPARAAAFCLVAGAGIGGLNMGAAWWIMRIQHNHTSSPNAGWTMAAAAGALDVCLEKYGCYQLNEKGRLPTAEDIRRANVLVGRAGLISVVLLAALTAGLGMLV